jgi:hypothetical protein
MATIDDALAALRRLGPTTLMDLGMAINAESMDFAAELDALVLKGPLIMTKVKDEKGKTEIYYRINPDPSWEDPALHHPPQIFQGVHVARS